MDFVASPTNMNADQDTQLPARVEQKAGLVHSDPANNISVQDAAQQPGNTSRPQLVSHVSSPAYASPLRHHRRHTSTPHQVKESLNARSEYVTSEDDGTAEHRINQYTIKEEIGRGSFGAVHLAVDQYGQEYAVKEFSKSRLRKRAQSHILRKPLSQRRAGGLTGFNSPLHRRTSDEKQTTPSAIELIKEEIAIMKKLNHPNLVSLIEVLDDPSEDSLYMIMEMCKKGVVMKVGLEEQADPYPDEQCREWFRDLLLGIEYLHAQGVVHRDIKPDNCLITEDDVLKIVDFGVSEMFEKDSEMLTAKSAGSPAFMPPELCVVRHGDVSGRAADIWSMGVTLYCLKFGKIPFEKEGMLDLYDAIRNDKPDMSPVNEPDFHDLIVRILEKDPSKRIKMRELREHPWVTDRGADPLLSEEENTANLVDPPTEHEINNAITGNMKNLVTVLKAVGKFKSLIHHDRPQMMNSILGENESSHFSLPPTGMKSKQKESSVLHRANSDALLDRDRVETALVTEGVHREIPIDNKDDDGLQSSHPQAEMHPTSSRVGNDESTLPLNSEKTPDSIRPLSRVPTAALEGIGDLQKLPFRANRVRANTQDALGHRGHAHDPLKDHLYLYIGPSTFAGPSIQERRPSFMPTDEDVPVVSESPGAADVDIYETAYRDEIERIRMAHTKESDAEPGAEIEPPTVFLNRRVDAKLLALSSAAGKVMAVSEEKASQIRDYTQFRERRAKVTEVSRALRDAMKEEYFRMKKETGADIAKKKDVSEKPAETEERDMAQEESQGADTGGEPSEQSGAPSAGERPGLGKTQSSNTRAAQQTANRVGKGAADAGRQARTGLMGFVDLVKQKSSTKKDADEKEEQEDKVESGGKQ